MHGRQTYRESGSADSGGQRQRLFFELMASMSARMSTAFRSPKIGTGKMR